MSAAETEVLEDSGDVGPGGVSDAVETSVSVEDTVSGKSLRGDSARSEAGLCGSSGVHCVEKRSGGVTAMTQGGVAGRSIIAGFGDSGGVETRRAFSSTSCGGRERGEIIMPGAREGFVGRRDQIAQPPNCCFGSIDAFCFFIDVDVGVGAMVDGAAIWGVDGSDLEASLEREGGVSEGGRSGAGEGEESGVGSSEGGF